MFTYTQANASFSVKDTGEAAQFYEDVLGCTVERFDGWLNIHTNGNQPIFAYEKENHSPASFTVFNFSVENIEAAVDALTTKGVSFIQYDGEMGTNEKGIFDGGQVKMAWFADPSGNIFALMEIQK